ncbi:MAG: Cu(I)-responsive transcriptional regulator [Rhodospirillales bacterium]|nr:Cu(I)-responsive transcriptional regulator [Rhodospirillales bacterium]
MNIGTAASKSGVPAKTIRYYESIGLIPRATRAGNGYRDYGYVDVATLKFIQRARRLGFSVKDVGNLLELWRDRKRSSASVKKVAMNHIGEIEKRIGELDSIRRTLVHLTDRCHGDERPECPIMDDLSGGEGKAA